MSSPQKLIVIGSGPAGYAASLYAARAQLAPLMFSGEKSGGQLMLTTHVENYPGYPEGVLGPELMLSMRSQAERFGTEIRDQWVSQVDFTERPFRVYVNEAEHLAEAVVLATGAESRLLKIPGESDYMGRGVSTCAVCDAAFYRDKRVYVVGGGDAAMEDTLALTKFAAEITILHRRESLRASKIMQQRVLEDNREKVSVRWNSELVRVVGDERQVREIVVRNTQDGSEETLPADGVFIAIGHKPATEFLGDQVELDEKGYVVTRIGLGAPSVAQAQAHLTEEGLLQFPTMTSVEGVFAGGDNVDFRYRQAVTAAGLGVMAALDAEWWLERS